jgi:hypothetical protein
MLASLGYGGIMALLAWQAQRGQSIVSPDIVTLTAFAVGTVLLMLGCVVTLFTRGSEPTKSI